MTKPSGGIVRLRCGDIIHGRVDYKGTPGFHYVFVGLGDIFFQGFLGSYETHSLAMRACRREMRRLKKLCKVSADARIVRER